MDQVPAGCGGTQGKSWGQQAEGSGPRSQLGRMRARAGLGTRAQGPACVSPPAGRAPSPMQMLALSSLTDRRPFTFPSDSCCSRKLLWGAVLAVGHLVARPGVRARDLSSPSHLLPLTHTHSEPRSSPVHQSLPQNAAWGAAGRSPRRPAVSAGGGSPEAPAAWPPPPGAHAYTLPSWALSSGVFRRGGLPGMGSVLPSAPGTGPCLSCPLPVPQGAVGDRRPHVWVSSVLAGNPAGLTPHFSTHMDQTSSCFLP